MTTKIIKALAKTLDKLCPDVINLFEKEEIAEEKAFVHYISFVKPTRVNFCISETVLDYQIVFICNLCDENSSIFEENMKIYDKLQRFLANGTLKVEENFVFFDSECKKTDDLLSFSLTFKYNTEVFDYYFEEIAEYMQKLYINKGE